jgi:hypothetical protein
MGVVGLVADDDGCVVAEASFEVADDTAGVGQGASLRRLTDQGCAL